MEQLGGLYLIMMWKGLVVFISLIMTYSIVDVALALSSMHLIGFL